MTRSERIAGFMELGYSQESAEMRADLVEKLAECERRGINPFPQLPAISIPSFPVLNFELPALPKLPEFEIWLPTIESMKP